ncbi:GNAT family N-acetyltransferase [Solibacillus sp. CAU 1738]|uniref:GNAT family N-acetyltransferase n=1 Tax=Solibacillus sp. CAU 1738 TaxID=3140363 RepID=UPI0032611CE7
MEIRKANIHDASEIVRVMTNAEESNFMLFEPGERQITVEQCAGMIENLNNAEKSALFVASEENKIYGYMIVRGDQARRISHRAYIVIGVHSDSRGKGVGTALFEHLHCWAKDAGLHRLELTVISNNDVAVGLYKKMGYEIEGVKKDSLFIDGIYVDEYYMAKLI